VGQKNPGRQSDENTFAIVILAETLEAACVCQAPPRSDGDSCVIFPGAGEKPSHITCHESSVLDLKSHVQLGNPEVGIRKDVVVSIILERHG